MTVLDESEYVVCKRLAQDIVKELKPISVKLHADLKKGVRGYNVIKNQFLTADSVEKLEFYSKKLREWQMAINKSFAVLDRVDTILYRNEDRVEFLQAKCDAAGIYNDKVENKTLQEKIGKNTKNIDSESLNLNQNARWAEISKFVDGEVLVFKNNKLNFSIEQNKQTLKTMSGDFISKIIEKYPYCVATIPDEIFANSGLKNKILKSCIVYVSANMKNMTLVDLNRKLGGLLTNVGNIRSLEEFAQELKNLFNVQAKNYLKSVLPNKMEEIDDKLKCNETSEFLPRSKVSGVLANGLAGEETKQSEEQESEEKRKEQEDETRLMLELDELLESLLGDSEAELEQEEKQEQQTQKQEEIKREEEKNIEDELQAQLERELERVLRKDNPDE